MSDGNIKDILDDFIEDSNDSINKEGSYKYKSAKKSNKKNINEYGYELNGSYDSGYDD